MRLNLKKITLSSIFLMDIVTSRYVSLVFFSFFDIYNDKEKALKQTGNINP